jgi:hypothetical protein
MAKTPRAETLRKMASLIEEHMMEKGCSEKEKNERVTRFACRIDARRANLKYVTVNINVDFG